MQRPLPHSHHTYTAGKSTETALHSVVIYIEDALEAKKTVIRAFVNIEGALSNTTRTTIDNALKDKGVPVSIRRWFNEMLSARTVYSEWKGKMVQGKIRDLSSHTSEI